MKIIDILNQNKLSLSFEVFPPKKEASFDSVRLATETIAALKPSFMSVTYGAGGGISQYTIDIAKNIKEKYDIPMLAHLTCVSSDKATVLSKIDDIKKAGIKNIMALRGDIPEEKKDEDRSSWTFHHALELIQLIKEVDRDFCVGAACYPEIHPESLSQHDDLLHLKEKVDAGADFLTTQMVFDNPLFFNFMYKLREIGVTVPVVPGIMPITNAKQVATAISLSGSFMPQRFKSLVDAFGHDEKAMQEAGIIYASDQIIDLYANGIKNIHVYSMNKPHVAEGIMRNVSSILGKSILL